MLSFSANRGQEWQQICQLLLALGLSGVIGIERQLKHKSAGLRTNILVGLGSALYMIISKYGFFDVLEPGRVDVDPSRVAAQVVSGVGFIGGGIIFKQESEVRGLTTAAAIWLTSAVGSACGSGLPILASLVTALYLVTVLVFPFIWKSLASMRSIDIAEDTSLIIRYHGSNFALEKIMVTVLKAGAKTVTIERVEEVMISSMPSPRTNTGAEIQSISKRQNGGPPSIALPSPVISAEPSRLFEAQFAVALDKSRNEIAAMLSDLPFIKRVIFEEDDEDEV